MKAYKGFNADMTCRNFQYEEGKEYATEKAVACETGFHACEYPLDVFGYYSPAEGHVFHEVELDGEFDKRETDKVAATKIKIGARLSLAGMVKAAVDFTLERIIRTNNANEDRSLATNTGTQSAATNTGDWSAATNTGNRSAATNTGTQSAATNTGDWSAATNTGNRSAATNTGTQSAATNTGTQSAATVEGKDSVAVAWGMNSAAAASKGSYIVLAEYDEDKNLIHAKMAKIDGEVYLPGVLYTLKNNDIVPVNRERGEEKDETELEY